MMNFCNWLFVVLLFLFATFKLFLRHSFNTFFFAKEQDRKRPFTSWICDSKTEMKVCHPWFVICNYFGPWTVPETPPPPSVLQGYSRYTWLPVFIFHESWIQLNYSLCSVTKWLSVHREKLELIIDIRDIISYFSLIFSFKTSGR